MALDFAHLHLHTLYSLLDGAIRVKDLVKTVVDKGMKSVAVTDHGNMFGALAFYKAAREAGVKPILGYEAYVAGPKGREDRSERVGHHLILLAENEAGYKNLRFLASKAYLEGFYYDPRIDKDLLRDHSEGLFGLTACMAGEVPRAARRGDMDAARKAALELKGLFQPGHFFLEIQSNGLPDQMKVNDHLRQLARDIEAPLAATADSHYVKQGDARAHEVLMAIASGKTLDDPKRLHHETDHLYIKSADEMLAALPGDMEAIQNTWRIAEKCNVELKLGETFLPQFKPPDDVPIEDYLRLMARKGLDRRFGELRYEVNRDVYRARLERELEVVVQMGFSGYFLIVQDFINWAKEHGIPVGPGRGSGAGSVVAWSLRITDLDPIKWTLLFERFLNPERVSMPDFDVDFCMNRRDEVLNYVADKYGRDNVGQIITFGALSAKSAIKDVGRVMGLPFNELNDLTKNLPALVDGHPVTLEWALHNEPKFKKALDEKPVYRDLIDIARALEGLNRNAGMHAAGVVIADRPLWEYVPLYRGQNGEHVTQFAKDEVEQAGLVKFDFLGLRTLTVVDDALKMVNRKRAIAGETPELRASDLPLEDAKVFAMLARGDTGGVFQMESSGFTEMMKSLKPDCFEDIIAAGALYRPGPLEAGMVRSFIERKHGREKVSYPHPKLEPLLNSTYGVIVYQEQVMQIAQVLAGYSLGRADLLRRAMGKKKAEVMAQERAGFVEGCVKAAVDEKLAGHIFDDMEKFAGYGFNKSHAAAYGVLTMQTAWLKAHHTVEFMAALLTSEKDNTDKVVAHIAEARDMGIKVLQPDVNESELAFSAVPPAPGAPAGTLGSIRFGLAAVKGVGEGTVEAVLTSREKKRFVGMFDFCARVEAKKLNRKTLEALVAAGAFDFTGRTRATLWASIDAALDSGASTQRDRALGQGSLFGLLGGGGKGGGDPDAAAEHYTDAPDDWPERERLAREKESVGFYITGHPLDRWRTELFRYGTHTCARLSEVKGWDKVAVAGIVYGWRERVTKTGKKIAFVTIEDLTGTRDVVVYDEQIQKYGALLVTDEPILIKGGVRLNERPGAPEGEEPKLELRCEEVVRLADVRQQKAKGVEIRVDAGLLDAPRVARLKDLLAATNGNTPVTLYALVPGASETRVALPFKVAPTDDLLAAVDRIFGAPVARVA